MPRNTRLTAAVTNASAHDGWQKWTTITKTGVTLDAGRQSMRIVWDANGPTGRFANFNYVQVR